MVKSPPQAVEITILEALRLARKILNRWVLVEVHGLGGKRPDRLRLSDPMWVVLNSETQRKERGC